MSAWSSLRVRDTDTPQHGTDDEESDKDAKDTYRIQIKPFTKFDCDVLTTGPALLKKAECIAINVLINMVPIVLFFNVVSLSNHCFPDMRLGESQIHVLALILVCLLCLQLFIRVLFKFMCPNAFPGATSTSSKLARYGRKSMGTVAAVPFRVFFIWFRIFKLVLLLATLLDLWLCAFVVGLVYHFFGSHDWNLKVVEITTKPGVAFALVYTAWVLGTFAIFSQCGVTLLEFFGAVKDCFDCMCGSGRKEKRDLEASSGPPRPPIYSREPRADAGRYAFPGPPLQAHGDPNKPTIFQPSSFTQIPPLARVSVKRSMWESYGSLSDKRKGFRRK